NGLYLRPYKSGSGIRLKKSFDNPPNFERIIVNLDDNYGPGTDWYVLSTCTIGTGELQVYNSIPNVTKSNNCLQANLTKHIFYIKPNANT
ncbi:hypothetical protein L9F63_019671, partial [Diploptera punctata]